MTTTTPWAPPVPTAPASPSPHRDPRWVRAALMGLLGGTALLYLWGLGAAGYANTFYSAAVQAGTTSWKAFFFGSSDGANSIMVDKPPASLWVMELSARIFGVNPWSILVPQALEGVAAVGVLYAAVRRWHGSVAGLLAGTVLALTPVAVLMFRFNNPDALLVLLLTLAAYALVRVLEVGRTGWLATAAVCLGFGFLTKMLQAFLVVPGLVLVHLVAAPVALRRRITQLLVAGVTLVISAGWWVAIVAPSGAAVSHHIALAGVAHAPHRPAPGLDAVVGRLATGHRSGVVLRAGHHSPLLHGGAGSGDRCTDRHWCGGVVATALATTAARGPCGRVGRHRGMGVRHARPGAELAAVAAGGCAARRPGLRAGAGTARIGAARGGSGAGGARGDAGAGRAGRLRPGHGSNRAPRSNSLGGQRRAVSQALVPVSEVPDSQVPICGELAPVELASGELLSAVRDLHVSGGPAARTAAVCRVAASRAAGAAAVGVAACSTAPRPTLPSTRC